MAAIPGSCAALPAFSSSSSMIEASNRSMRVPGATSTRSSRNVIGLLVPLDHVH
jgi:hypothetical protein